MKILPCLCCVARIWRRSESLASAATLKGMKKVVVSVLSLLAAEVAILVVVGPRLGASLVLLWLLGSAALGGLLLRKAAPAALAALPQAALGGARSAAWQTALVAIAGLLLVIPGFLTDVVGLALLLPPVRRRAGRALGARATALFGGGVFSPFGPGGFGFGPAPRRSGVVIDVEANEAKRPPAQGPRRLT